MKITPYKITPFTRLYFNYYIKNQSKNQTTVDTDAQSHPCRCRRMKAERSASEMRSCLPKRCATMSPAAIQRRRVLVETCRRSATWSRVCSGVGSTFIGVSCIDRGVADRGFGGLLSRQGLQVLARRLVGEKADQPDQGLVTCCKLWVDIAVPDHVRSMIQA